MGLRIYCKISISELEDMMKAATQTQTQSAKQKFSKIRRALVSNGNTSGYLIYM